MQKIKILEEVYDSCISEGYLRNVKELNTKKIVSMLNNANISTNSAVILAQALHKESKEWMNVFTLYYEALRMYAGALLLFEKVQSNNHQCLFAALCLKFPNLELDWNFFEAVRTKRNGINYYGEQVAFQDWKAIEIQLRLYISTLHKEAEKRLP